MQTSLVEIYRAGAPISYLKGISHMNYNVCANTHWALQQCTKILHETSDKHLMQLASIAPMVKYCTEYRLYSWRKMRGTPSEHLDDLIDMPLFTKIFYDPESMSYLPSSTRHTGLWSPDHELLNTTNVHLCSDKSYYYEFFIRIVREVNWMEKIIPNISKEPCFIVCGFGHLEGLISLLQEEGFTCKNIVQSYPVFI